MMDESRQSILSHLNELRWRLVKSAAAVLIGSVIALIFGNYIKDLLQLPYDRAFPGEENTLQVLAPTEEFSVLMKIAFFGGLVLASPAVIYQVWMFINPALTQREKKWAIPIVISCTVLFCAGVAVGYQTMGRGLAFLLGIFDDVANNLRLTDYFSFSIRFLLAFGISFLYPVFLFTAAAANIVTSKQLARGRRWAVLLVVTGAAIITPTGDVLTLAMLSVPLYAFYEITYWLVRLVLRK